MNGAVLQLSRATTQRLRNEAYRSCSSLVTTSFESDDQVESSHLVWLTLIASITSYLRPIMLSLPELRWQ